MGGTFIPVTAEMVNIVSRPGGVIRLPNAGFISMPSDVWGSMFLAKEIDDELLKAYEEELKWVE